MNTDDFEQQLQRQPIRPMPGEWREDILRTAAKTRLNPQLSTPNSQPSSWWRELLWPCPQAWAGLAAVWVLILVLNEAARDPVQIAKASKAVPAPEMLMSLQEHRRLLADLIESPTAVEPPKPSKPRPRSESSRRFIAV